jgi:SAM-dependent methyltransferase
LFSAQAAFSVNDLGCGVADFANYLFDKGFTNFNYTGYDVLEEMVQISTEKYQNRNNCSFVHINDATELDEADYTVASGIFNIRYAISDADWLAYILQTIGQINAKSRKGFAFNALTSYSDKDKMQDYLYYSDPLYLFDYCKKNFSRNIALLHDYYQYDFTIIVRKE